MPIKHGNAGRHWANTEEMFIAMAADHLFITMYKMSLHSKSKMIYLIKFNFRLFLAW
jgi:hypothetical protein